MSKEKEKMRFVRFNRSKGEDRGVRFTNYNDKEIEFNIHRFDTGEYWSVGPEVTLNTEEHMVSFVLGLFWFDLRVSFEWHWLRNLFNKLTKQTRETGLTISNYRIALKILNVDDSWMDVFYWLKSKGWDTKLAKKGWVNALHKYIVNGWSLQYWWFRLTDRSFCEVDRLSGTFRIGDVVGPHGKLERDYPDIQLKWEISEVKGGYSHWLTKLVKPKDVDRLIRLDASAVDEVLGKYKAIFPAMRGKGENSWDCDDDIFIPQISFGAEDPEEFIYSVKLAQCAAKAEHFDPDTISVIAEIPSSVIEKMVLSKLNQSFDADVKRRGQANDYEVGIGNGTIKHTTELENEDTYGSH